jgi:polyhydroxyalkanoate synthesis regulator phasin
MEPVDSHLVEALRRRCRHGAAESCQCLSCQARRRIEALQSGEYVHQVRQKMHRQRDELAELKQEVATLRGQLKAVGVDDAA